jgi:ribosome-associated protein
MSVIEAVKEAVITFEDKIRFLVELLREKNAESLSVFDLRKLDGVIIDGFIVCSGLSEKHVSSIAEHAAVGLKEAGEPVGHIEGNSVNQWVLVDCGDIVLHIFLDQIRDYYRLEDLWAHADEINVTDGEPPEKHGTV